MKKPRRSVRRRSYIFVAGGVMSGVGKGIATASIGALLKAHKATVLRFVRFELGEGIEKKADNFAAEVMAQVQGN
jgi:hypothetical protein